jgi:BolA protein
VPQDTESLIAAIASRLREAFAPERLRLEDESLRHRHHPGRGSGLHLRLEIVSARFRGRSALERHREIYAVLSEYLPGAIHALAIQARAPEEIPSETGRNG